MNKEREEIDKYDEDSNIKYFGDKVIMYKGQSMLRSVNEIIRIIDAIKKEVRYFKEKFPRNEDIIDL